MVLQHKVPVLLTRPEAQSRRFAERLPDAAEPVIAPLQRIVFLDAELPLDEAQVVIFTSQNGVLAATRLHAGDGRRAYCVGSRTAAIAQANGFVAQDCGGRADLLVDWILQARDPGPFLRVRGRHSRGDVAGRLRSAGLQVTDVVLYEQLELPFPEDVRRRLLSGRILVPLFSPRSATLFQAAIPEAPDAELICISGAAADAVRSVNYRDVHCLAEPTADAMLEEVSRRASGKSLEGSSLSG